MHGSGQEMEGSQVAAEALGGFVAKALGGDVNGTAEVLLAEVRLRGHSVFEPRIVELDGEHGVVEQLACFCHTDCRYCSVGIAIRQSL